MLSRYEATFPPSTENNLDEEKTDESEERPGITQEPHDAIDIDESRA